MDSLDNYNSFNEEKDLIEKIDDTNKYKNQIKELEVNLNNEDEFNKMVIVDDI